jgi:hypothetical protein
MLTVDVPYGDADNAACGLSMNSFPNILRVFNT